ncbi:MAG: hypothetical protein M0R38_10095 [Bacteroidia bacterium]|nr:hypothetical protein [Bacteroidia bacterium]
MTSKEALERLKFIADKELNIGFKSYDDLQEFWNYKEPLKVIEKLVERDTPMMPVSESIELICPKCREEQHTNTVKFCSECGQRLDWSDEE